MARRDLCNTVRIQRSSWYLSLGIQSNIKFISIMYYLRPTFVHVRRLLYRADLYFESYKSTYHSSAALLSLAEG